MKRLVALLVIFVTISPLSAREFHLPAEMEIGESNAKDKFYPIGWSKDGKFAYVKFRVVEGGCGTCPFYYFVVQSAVTDAVPFTRRLDGKRMGVDYSVKPFSEIWEEHYDLFRGKLKEYGIVQQERFTPGGIEFHYKGSDYKITKKFNKIKKEFRWFMFEGVETVIERLDLSVLSTRLGGKRVYQFRSGKGVEILNTKILGHLRSPFEDRMLILFLEEHLNQEGGGSAGYTLRLVGSHLRGGFRKR